MIQTLEFYESYEIRWWNVWFAHWIKTYSTWKLRNAANGFRQKEQYGTLQFIVTSLSLLFLWEMPKDIPSPPLLHIIS